MKRRFLSIPLLAILFFATSCEKEPVTSAPQTAQQGAALAAADFSRYIAVGNSITSGYSNSGLYLEGQQVAYPNLVAMQMKLVGGGAFSQPLFSTAQANGSGYLRLAGFNTDGSPLIVPVTSNLAIRGVTNVPGYGPVTLYTKYAGDLNNYGVPGIKLQQITLPILGNLNPYFERLLPGEAGTNSTPYLDFVTAKPFTFFSSWLGNNDVLGYATSGGEGDVLTDKTQFAALYALAVSTLTKNGAGGILVSVPDLTVLPYLNTITIQNLVDAANKVNSAVHNIYISAMDPATGQYATRAATASDLIGITFDATTIGSTVNGVPGYGLLPSNPLMSKDVLDAAEVAKAREYTAFYNTTIKNLATLYNLAFFDSFDFLNKVKTGMQVNGVFVNAAYITGGVFSLDGIHLTPRGNAITANEFIKAINAKYGTAIPQLDVSAYKGLL